MVADRLMGCRKEELGDGELFCGQQWFVIGRQSWIQNILVFYYLWFIIGILSWIQNIFSILLSIVYDR